MAAICSCRVQALVWISKLAASVLAVGSTWSVVRILSGFVVVDLSGCMSNSACSSVMSHVGVGNALLPNYNLYLRISPECSGRDENVQSTLHSIKRGKIKFEALFTFDMSQKRVTKMRQKLRRV